MAQKLPIPPCPDAAGGHAWRLAREHSTKDCQVEACEACGLVRMTSYRTGQIIRYEPAGNAAGTPLKPRTQAQSADGPPGSTPTVAGHEGWLAEEVPSVSLTIRFLAVCRECGDVWLAVRMVAAGRSTGESGLPRSDDWTSWNTREMRAAIDYLDRKRA
ncbi:MAG: hypothetical protein OXH69_22300 [Acidobacteria bacterium]|nr:hypothetical protein [Acidobacteriota bacterium]